ncbi:MAG: sugar kinase [Candidatus Marinimicrobia bacterium]|nr:sugar kinase [Candidatus Neomarinimicrobiota bacterium]
MKIKEKSNCKYDLISLGEVMLRMDPGEGRIRTARSFKVWEGGGEYNVARAIKKCFNKRSAIVSAFVRNEVGKLVEDLILQGGVDTRFIKWEDFDGLGRLSRNGVYFLEKGFGVRGALSCSDRGHTAISQLQPGDIDWDYIFGELGVRWFHTGGIYAGLSESAPMVILEAMKSAKSHGTIISYDLNYRASLWEAFGGHEAAQKINNKIAKYVDVMIGNEEDFTACLGFQVKGVDKNLKSLPIDGFKKMVNDVSKEYQNLKVIGTTLRVVKNAGVNDWGAIAWNNDEGFVESKSCIDLDIYDRVGGGDGFASGLIYGIMEDIGLEKAVNYGAAHGALAMTTPGDTSMVSLDEVVKLVENPNLRVVR